MPAIKVELASGQTVAVEKANTIRAALNGLTEWVRFEPIIPEGQQHKPHAIVVRATHVVAMWEVDEQPLYRLTGVK